MARMASGEFVVEINFVCLKSTVQIYSTTQIFQLHSMDFLSIFHFYVHLLIADKNLLYQT
jgi:hypothetical protein